MLVIHVINGTIYMADFAAEDEDGQRVPMVPVSLDQAVMALRSEPQETLQ